LGFVLIEIEIEIGFLISPKIHCQADVFDPQTGSLSPGGLYKSDPDTDPDPERLKSRLGKLPF